MGILELQFCGTLENLEGLALPADEDWHFQVKCANCGEVHPNVIYFNLVELRGDLEDTRQKAHYAAKCGFCKRDQNVLFLEGTYKTYSAKNSE